MSKFQEGNLNKEEALSKYANLVEEGDSESCDEDILSVSYGSDHLSNSWIMVSEYLYHMTLNKEWFDTYRLANFGTFLIGNDVLYKVISIGSIKVRCLV